MRACQWLFKIVPDLVDILTELEGQEEEDADAITAIDAAVRGFFSAYSAYFYR